MTGWSAAGCSTCCSGASCLLSSAATSASWATSTGKVFWWATWFLSRSTLIWWLWCYLRWACHALIVEPTVLLWCRVYTCWRSRRRFDLAFWVSTRCLLLSLVPFFQHLCQHGTLMLSLPNSTTRLFVLFVVRVDDFKLVSEFLRWVLLDHKYAVI